MYDHKRIAIIIADIEKYLAELGTYTIKEVDDLKDSMRYHATSMVLFAILNRLIDVSTEMITAEHLGAPQNYQEIMPLLAEANVINKDYATRLNLLIKERNTLAHFYGEITRKKLFDMVEEVTVIEQFIKTIKKRIQKQEQEHKDHPQ